MLSGTMPFYGRDKAEVYRNTCSGAYAVDGPEFAQISHDAVGLIHQLLVVDPARRLTPDGVFAHPWMAKDHVVNCVEIKILRRVRAESPSSSAPSTRRLLDGDRARTAASSPRNDLVKNYRVHPTHWLISAQVEVTGAPEKEPALTRDLNPFTETGAALRRARLRKKWAQIEEIRRDEPVIYGPVAGQQNPVLAIKAADDDAPPEEPEETTEWSVDDPNGSSSPLRAVREEWPAGA